MLWAANVLLAVFAPAFPLSLLRQEIRPQTAQAHSLGRWQQAEEKGQWLNLWLTTKRRVCESEKRH